MLCNFRIGQKVVCIDTTGAAAKALVENKIYTIDGIFPVTKDTKHFIFVSLAELPIKKVKKEDISVCEWEPVWFHHRFKPIVENDGMAMLKKFERPPKQKQVRKVVERV